MSIGWRISQARRAAGFSQQGLATLLGVGQTTLSSWERDRTEPSRSDVRRLESALRLAPGQLEAGPGRRTVPLVGYVGAGAEAHFYATADAGLGEVDAPEGANENTVAAEIRGVSLGPVFERWLIYYDDVRSPVTPDMFGELCIVGLPDDRVLVKQIKPTSEPNRFHLLSNSSDPPIFDQEVLWAAKVTDMKRR